MRQSEGRLNIANLSYANAQLEVVRQLAAQGNFNAALIILAPAKRTILHTCFLLSRRPDAKPSADAARVNLSRVDTQLSRATQGTPFNSNVLYGRHSGTF